MDSPVIQWVFPGGSMIKKPPPMQETCGDIGSIAGSGRSPREGNGNLLQYSCLGNPMGRGAWWGCSPWSRKESVMSDTIITTAACYSVVSALSFLSLQFKIWYLSLRPETKIFFSYMCDIKNPIVFKQILSNSVRNKRVLSTASF